MPGVEPTLDFEFVQPPAVVFRMLYESDSQKLVISKNISKDQLEEKQKEETGEFNEEKATTTNQVF